MISLALFSLLALQAEPAQKQTATVQKALQDNFRFENLPKEGQRELFMRVMASRERFVNSEQYLACPTTLHKFFTKTLYSALEGNPFIGYYYVEPGFKWPQAAKNVQFEGVSGLNEAKAIQPHAYYLATEAALKHMGLTMGPSDIRLKGCTVSIDQGSPNKAKGVWMELQIFTPSGSVYYRLGLGKKTIGDSIGANIESALRFARENEDGSQPRPASLKSRGARVR